MYITCFLHSTLIYRWTFIILRFMYKMTINKYNIPTLSCCCILWRFSDYIKEIKLLKHISLIKYHIVSSKQLGIVFCCLCLLLLSSISIRKTWGLYISMYFYFTTWMNGFHKNISDWADHQVIMILNGPITLHIYRGYCGDK
jgi:hypothetical protein